MSALADFFARNFIGVYFFYGLSFFSMGLAIFLELGHSSELDFASALKPLAGFGLIHGSHEWFEMFLLINPDINYTLSYSWISPLRLLLLASSFMMLINFGVRLIIGPERTAIKWMMVLSVIALWIIGLLWVVKTQSPGPSRIIALDVYTRYGLAIPGAALTMWGLLLQRQKFLQMGMQSFGRDVAVAALAFGLYGGIGQLFASPSAIFPSIYLNADLFVHWFGFPVQVFRASMACVSAISIIHSLRAFEVENNYRIENLRKAQQEERHHLETLREELLHQTVKAQEAERQRIARELHDETGQTLTALGLGLRGLSENITSNPERALQQAQQLETLTGEGLEELQRMVSGLHPPQLDDLGILAALRWYANEITDHFDLPISVVAIGIEPKLPPEFRAVFFRIAQEAITNIVRHAKATQASMQWECMGNLVRLKIEDDGQGFDVDKVLDSTTAKPHWGLLGMMERATLIDGLCTIRSELGNGTLIEVSVQLGGKPNA